MRYPGADPLISAPGLPPRPHCGRQIKVSGRR